MVAIPSLSAPIRALSRWRPSLHGEGVLSAFARMSDAVGAPIPRLVADFAALALGPGRVAFADYERLRLYDTAFWSKAYRREVVGAARGRELVRAANFRRDCQALAADRLAAGAYLAAHGLPTAPALAIYRAGLAAPGEALLRSRGELRQFLQAHAGAPLTVRPAEGAASRTLFADGRDPAAQIDRLVDEVGDAPGLSWLIQPWLTPHPAIARRTGGRAAPVQLVTLAGEAGARLFRALWRLGGRDDLVASLDLRSGEALTLFPAKAPDRAQPAPAGLAVPDWARLKAAACEGARLFGQFGLLGWEIAPTDAGPVIAAVDPAPDLDLWQLADRCGVLDPELQGFLAARRRARAEWRRAERL
ncbi:MAG TPA: hypothetical protein VGG29_11355 [Caulobacteraceae bacterium]|jgi:hypothetical protein